MDSIGDSLEGKADIEDNADKDSNNAQAVDYKLVVDSQSQDDFDVVEFDDIDMVFDFLVDEIVDLNIVDIDYILFIDYSYNFMNIYYYLIVDLSNNFDCCYSY